jgi:hypothetical protein
MTDAPLFSLIYPSFMTDKNVIFLEKGERASLKSAIFENIRIF